MSESTDLSTDLAVDLSTDLCGVTLKNPVIAASGCFGFGEEYRAFYDVGLLGGIASKGLTLNPRQGNSGPRVWETPSGMMNSVGLQNPGVRHFIDHELPAMRQLGTVVIANCGGGTIEEYCEGTRLLDAAEGVDLIELNISCPNVQHGGMEFGLRCEAAHEVVAAVRAGVRGPLMVKLSPNAENIVELAQACVEAGADALSLVNTFKALAVNRKTSPPSPMFHNVTAGLSGPAIRPIALRMVYEVCGAVAVPVVGLGGIETAADALDFLAAGARAIQVGTANFANPHACPQIIEGIGAFLSQHNSTLEEIRGSLR